MDRQTSAEREIVSSIIGNRQSISSVISIQILPILARLKLLLAFGHNFVIIEDIIK